MKSIPYGQQWIGPDEAQSVAEAVQAPLITTGPRALAFEHALAEACGAPHAVAVSNGTAALHLALLAADIRPGDRVLTTPNTFLASANCAEFIGATADFADIDPATRCLSVETLALAWKPDVKAVVAVDFAGYPCVTPELAAFVHDRGAILVEDACHAIGGRVGAHRVGGLPGADLTTFSFHPVKTITTGEGGAILAANPAWDERLRLLRSHGMIRTNRDEHGEAPWFYEMHELGYNYRITDFQCALGIAQLTRLAGFVRRRADIVARYDEALRGLPHVQTPRFALPSDCDPSWHLYVVEIDFPALGRTRTEVMNALVARGIGTQVHYIPVHTQPYYRRKHGYDWGKCPAAEHYYRRALSLPLYPAMTDADVERVIAAVRQVCVA